jgi:hypothetical protein
MLLLPLKAAFPTSPTVAAEISPQPNPLRGARQPTDNIGSQWTKDKEEMPMGRG